MIVLTINQEELRQIIAEEISKIPNRIPAEQQISQSKVYLSQAEVASRFHVSKATIIEWQKLGKINASRLGRRVLYLQSDIESAMVPIKTRKQ